MASATPMMKQYRAIKNRHRDAILFFRLGDFYEMFEHDAMEASSLLDLTLTQRNGIPMCGIPYHASEGYIARLLKAGKKIAVCEQTHIPPKGKAIATREITEVITPGTVVDENLLDRTANNYLLCLGQRREDISLAYIDLSTGDFCATHFPCGERMEKLKKEFLRLSPRELLIQESLLEDDPFIGNLLAEREGLVVNRYPDWSFDPDSNRERLTRQLKVSNLRGFGLEDDAAEIITAGVILDYVSLTSRAMLAHIRNLSVYTDAAYVGLDESTQKNLELIQNLNERTRRYTLLEVLDQTRSAMGARKLKRWILRPLKDPQVISQRLERVDTLYRNQILLSGVREHLAKMFDLERLTSRLAMEKAHAKDLLAIKETLAKILALAEMLSGEPALQPLLLPVEQSRDLIREMVDLLESAIREEPSLLLTEGNLIKPGYDSRLAEYHHLKNHARQVLEEYLRGERNASGINSLKLKYNRIIGYFLEVTKANIHLVPDHFIRRQTLVGGERYTTEALADRESEINNASEKIVEREREIFLEVRSRIRRQVDLCLNLCGLFSELDVLQSFAFAATVHGYTKPVLHRNRSLKIEEGRHPVVEANLPGGAFVPNSLQLAPPGRSFVLLTGPNMAGKSTFLRQIALIVLMAQVGSFVPASEAQIGIVDSIFCRVGATDNLARGESTFLVEMNETANILRSATENSLIIMDEVGRGTGTNDGLAIAWAVSRYILEHIKAKTLFATHYHQLTRLQHRNLANLSMAVLEKAEEIVFLKRVQEGPTDNSYGIHVAQLAGIPAEVITRAREVLSELADKKYAAPPPAPEKQPMLFSLRDVVQEEILALKVEETTPLEALRRIARWQEELRKEPPASS
jgi:DNA mismatch repair protein MutS